MQLERWKQEYEEVKNLPSSRTSKPSRAVKEFLETTEIEKDTALDIGSGKGRNSFYLASQGFAHVTGVEMVQSAVDFANTQNYADGVQDKVTFLTANVGEPLAFDDNSFKLVLDMMVMHLLDKAERNTYASEVVRLVKPGGFFVFYTIAANSPAAQDLFAKHPGPEENSYVIPQSGMIEKAFSKEELVEMFKPKQVVRLDEVTEFTPAFGDVYERMYLSGVFKY